MHPAAWYHWNNWTNNEYHRWDFFGSVKADDEMMKPVADEAEHDLKTHEKRRFEAL